MIYRDNGCFHGTEIPEKISQLNEKMQELMHGSWRLNV
ncbi:MAG: hypothetical protein BMS9Abin30_0358 [Gammaproteobacteria bacterium]|nr:MAG: hypothetical protein BMS9Abin30_0358 [Gammaproteobacteria bacterium]